MTHNDISQLIELYAPLSLQENYDNAGWQIGQPEDNTTGILLTLDVTLEVIQEALNLNCNLIIAHHPLIFSGLKSIIGRTETEKIILKALSSGISIYACHTNLDNVYFGVNHKIAEKLKLKKLSLLQPKKDTLNKLVTFVPEAHSESLLDALFQAGAGKIGEYSECAFKLKGEGSFRPSPQAQPTIGEPGGARETVAEVRLEVLVHNHSIPKVISVLHQAHPYEEVAYELYPILNNNQSIGAGMMGELEQTMTTEQFLKFVKQSMNTGVIRHTVQLKDRISKVAVCGGSGSFLLESVIHAKCDVFITGDFKYHQFFDGHGRIMILDIGHYESEQFTPEIFYDIIKDKFPNFAVRISKVHTNPINYYI